MSYPDCFPENFETEILPKNLKSKCLEVYRIILSGKIDKDGFESTFEDVLKQRIQRKKPLDMTDPGTYSTSCFIDIKYAKQYLNMFCRHHPAAILAKGCTDIKCGPSQITKERLPDNYNTHVDWWIYKDAQPQIFFEEVNNE